jgi:hypothetical protein
MYLIILEDGEIRKTNEIEDDTYQNCDDGVCDLIDISGKEPLGYFQGEWVEIQSAD